MALQTITSEFTAEQKNAIEKCEKSVFTFNTNNWPEGTEFQITGHKTIIVHDDERNRDTACKVLTTTVGDDKYLYLKALGREFKSARTDNGKLVQVPIVGTLHDLVRSKGNKTINDAADEIVKECKGRKVTVKRSDFYLTLTGNQVTSFPMFNIAEKKG